MLKRKKVIEILRREFPHLRDKFGVKKIALFGSFAKDTQKRSSDIDIVIETEEQLGFKFLDLVDYLEEVLGRKIDALTADAVKTIRIKKVAQDIKRSLLYV